MNIQPRVIAGVLLSVLSIAESPLGQGGNVATQRLVGYVLGSTGDPSLPDHITVQIELEGTGLKRQALVNASGYFQFDGLPPGRFRMTVASPGRQTVVQYVDVRVGMVAPRGPEGSGQETRTYVNLGPVIDPAATPDVNPALKTVSADLLAVPRQAMEELEKAERAADGGDTERAIEHLKRALEIHPDFPQASVNLAAQLVKLNRHDEAVEALRRSIELRDPNPPAHRNLGLIHLQRRRYPEAIAALGNAARQDPEDPQNALLLGRAHYESADPEEALPWLEKAVALEASNPVAQLTLGYCYLKLKRYAETLRCFDRFLELEPEGERALQVRDLAARIRRALAGNGCGGRT